MRRSEWFTPYIRNYSWRFVLIIALTVLTLLTAGSLMFTSGYLISKSALRPENVLMVYVPIVAVRTFGISRSVVHYVQRLVSHDAILRILSRMRVRLYQILEPQALFIRSRYRTGDIFGVLADDVEHLQDVYLRTVFPSVAGLIIYTIVIGAVGMFDWSFALLLAIYLFVLVAVLPAISLVIMKKKSQQVKQGRNRLYSKLTDAVLGIGDWVISGRHGEFIRRYEDEEQKTVIDERSLARWARWRNLIAQCVIGAVVVSTVYWSGQQVAEGQMNPTLIAAFVLVIFPVMDAFLPLSEAVQKIPQYQDSLDRIMKIAEQGKEIEYRDGSQIEISDLHENKVGIKLEHVSFRYSHKEDWSIQDLNLDLPHGKKIAVIGRSGAGKSTLIKLIQGALMPQQGTVTINGVASAEWGEQIPCLLSVLNQSPHLFDTSVGNNIRIGKPEATEEEIHRAVAGVCMDGLIDSLPEGFETPMRETGQRFSGGERQRIALARILLQDTPAVILDEPTVGLDPRTERELLAAIFDVLDQKTLIWITHHLVGVEHMDEVIFMENGRIEMRGTHQELLSLFPRYRHLYELDRPGMPGLPE